MCPSCKKRLSNNILIFGAPRLSAWYDPLMDLYGIMLSYEALRARNMQDMRGYPSSPLDAVYRVRYATERQGCR